MAETTGIEWTRYTFNPWRGCTKVSPACSNCYAENDLSVKLHGIGWGDEAERLLKAESGWNRPLAWNRKAEREGKIEPVFCGSLMDICEDRDELNEPRTRVFELAEQTPNLWWQFLTKRPENISSMTPMSWDKCVSGIPRNVSFGSTMENQKYVDKRTPHLVKLDCLTFASAEPLLAELNIHQFLSPRPGCKGGAAHADCEECGEDARVIDWVIVGGESGPKARRTEDCWIRSLVYQCREAGVPVFVKQRTFAGKKIPFEQWPQSLQVREFPEVTRVPLQGG